MNSTPKTSRLCSETIQRSVSNRRVYCAKPTKSFLGKIFELLNEIRTDHSTVPM